MCYGLDNRRGAFGRITALEDTGTDEHTVHAELHHQRRIRRGGHAARGKVDDGQAAQFLGLLDQLVGSADLLGISHELLVGHRGQSADLAQYGTGMTNGFHHVACARLTLGADHGRALADAAQRLAEVAAAAHERYLEQMFVDVVGLVGGSQYFGFVNIVYTDRFEDLRFDKVPDAAFRHHRNRHRIHDLRDQAGVRHAGYAAVGTNIRRDALQSHDGTGSGILCDFGVFRGDHIHDHSAFEHLR